MEVMLQIGLSIATAIIAGFVGWLFHNLKKREDKRAEEENKRLQEILARERAVNNALRALCRDRILQSYKYHKKRGCIPTADLETVTKLYGAYHALGGNGTITAIYKKFRDLHVEERDYDEKPRYE